MGSAFWVVSGAGDEGEMSLHQRIAGKTRRSSKNLGGVFNVGQIKNTRLLRWLKSLQQKFNMLLNSHHIL